MGKSKKTVNIIGLYASLYFSTLFLVFSILIMIYDYNYTLIDVEYKLVRLLMLIFGIIFLCIWGAYAIFTHFFELHDSGGFFIKLKKKTDNIKRNIDVNNTQTNNIEKKLEKHNFLNVVFYSIITVIGFITLTVYINNFGPTYTIGNMESYVRMRFFFMLYVIMVPIYFDFFVNSINLIILNHAK